MSTEPLHTPEETAKILGISIKTLREHVDMGRIRSILMGTGKKRKHRRFTDKNIATFIQAQKVREVPPCQFTAPKTLPITTLGSNSTVIAFTALQEPEIKKTLNK
ncbi:helix-turn-helix domain-containing protein [Agrobacterium salinitolerans]|uniref:DNA-binding protein n=1 Tax=Agrobacterium salinitolerans TaxID=1183413 RepID=A0ABY3BS64_9HYPH|nr:MULTISPECIES: helix-turn-helix domain-containing protein [Agrobacterium]MCZ7891908.1 helix-turn-helix domain-containing protein [Agrobacterium salinitolerans]TRA94042.1 DNA-binding protein [Agrobacterium salinitolerans]